MRIKWMLVVILLSCIVAVPTLANQWTSLTLISKIDVRADGRVNIFIPLHLNPVGCSTTEAPDGNGDHRYGISAQDSNLLRSMPFAAYVAGKRVSLLIDDVNCYGSLAKIVGLKIEE